MRGAGARGRGGRRAQVRAARGAQVRGGAGSQCEARGAQGRGARGAQGRGARGEGARTHGRGGAGRRWRGAGRKAGEQLTAASRRRRRGARAPPASGGARRAPPALPCPMRGELGRGSGQSCAAPQVRIPPPSLGPRCFRNGAPTARPSSGRAPGKGIAAIWEGESAVGLAELARGGKSCISVSVSARACVPAPSSITCSCKKKTRLVHVPWDSFPNRS